MRKTFFFVLIITAWSWVGCSSSKSVPAHDKLYTGARITVNNISNSRERKTLKSDLEDLTRPKPNTRFLGIRFKLGFYNLFYKAKPKSFFGKMRDKIGEPPVLASQLDLQKNIQILQNHTQNKGYFKAMVTGDTISKKKTVKAEYTVNAGVQYKIDSVHFPKDSSNISEAVRQSTDNTLLKTGDPFDLDVIKGERSRIDESLKENGFYYFSPDYHVGQDRQYNW